MIVLRGIDRLLKAVWNLLHVYWLPLLLGLIVLVIQIHWFGGFSFLYYVARRVRDREWSADHIYDFLLLPALIGWIVSLSERARQKKERAPYLGWTLIQKGLPGFEDGTQAQPLYWSDVEKFENSLFEYWKFIKSAVSSACIIKTIDINEAELRWLRKDSATRTVTINYAAMTEDDVAKWQDIADIPDTWELREAPPKDNRLPTRKLDRDAPKSA